VTKLAGESDEYPGINPSERNIVYEFVHDRVQQAVYSLVDEDEKKKCMS
jgi:predicted ATPase